MSIVADDVRDGEVVAEHDEFGLAVEVADADIEDPGGVEAVEFEIMAQAGHTNRVGLDGDDAASRLEEVTECNRIQANVGADINERATRARARLQKINLFLIVARVNEQGTVDEVSRGVDSEASEDRLDIDRPGAKGVE